MNSVPWGGSYLRVGLLLVLAAPAAAQGEGSLPRHPSDTARVTAPPFRHHVTGFAGVTFDDGEGGFTLGAQYERRFHRWYGVGAVTQAVVGKDRDFLIGPSFFLHPLEALTVGLTPGAERADEDWDFLFRLGLDYVFELKQEWTIGPTLALDFARGQRIYVIGVSIGRTFGRAAQVPPTLNE